MVTSRGCPYPCTFCDASVVHGRRYRAYSAERVVAELREPGERPRGARGAFKDSEFTIDRARVDRFCDLMTDGGPRVSWTCSARVDRVDGPPAEEDGCGRVPRDPVRCRVGGPGRPRRAREGHHGDEGSRGVPLGTRRGNRDRGQPDGRIARGDLGLRRGDAAPRRRSPAPITSTCRSWCRTPGRRSTPSSPGAPRCRTKKRDGGAGRSCDPLPGPGRIAERVFTASPRAWRQNAAAAAEPSASGKPRRRGTLQGSIRDERTRTARSRAVRGEPGELGHAERFARRERIRLRGGPKRRGRRTRSAGDSRFAREPPWSGCRRPRPRPAPARPARPRRVDRQLDRGRGGEGHPRQRAGPAKRPRAVAGTHLDLGIVKARDEDPGVLPRVAHDDDPRRRRSPREAVPPERGCSASAREGGSGNAPRATNRALVKDTVDLEAAARHRKDEGAGRTGPSASGARPRGSARRRDTGPGSGASAPRRRLRRLGEREDENIAPVRILERELEVEMRARVGREDEGRPAGTPAPARRVARAAVVSRRLDGQAHGRAKERSRGDEGQKGRRRLPERPVRRPHARRGPACQPASASRRAAGRRWGRSASWPAVEGEAPWVDDIAERRSPEERQSHSDASRAPPRSPRDRASATPAASSSRSAGVVYDAIHRTWRDTGSGSRRRRKTPRTAAETRSPTTLTPTRSRWPWGEGGGLARQECHGGGHEGERGSRRARAPWPRRLRPAGISPSGSAPT